MEEKKKDKLIIWGTFAALCVAGIGLTVVEIKIKKRMQYKMIEKALDKALSETTLNLHLFVEGKEIPLTEIKNF